MMLAGRAISAYLGPMSPHSRDLFGAEPSLPPGFRYQPDLISAEEERALVARVAELPFKEFEFQGYRGKRRVVSFGWQYDFTHARLHRVEDMPEFLLAVRDRAAAFAGIAAADLQHVLLTEYGPGAPIGWHRDRGVFAEVVGISLVSPCTFRLRRKAGDRWERVNLVLEPRSAYLLEGLARTEWEHSIPPVEQLRYSITFRNLKPR
jgi:alkylated DNA repair dioxygenase AlkB